MPEFHAEPYLHLAGLSSTSALIAWGAFYFRVRRRGEWKLVDDADLAHVHPPRSDSIGVRSAPYGIARVTVADASGRTVSTAETSTTNWCHLTGLTPDTEYTYQVIVNGEVWADGDRYDWRAGAAQGLVRVPNRYRNTFRTHPSLDQDPSEPITFAVIGDFGIGIRKSSPTRRQAEVAGSECLFYGPVEAALPVYVAADLHADAGLLGAYWAAFGVGALVAALLTGTLGARNVRRAALLIVAGWGACLLPFAFAPVGVTLVCFTLGGLVYGPFIPITYAQFQSAATPANLPAVLAARGAIVLVATPLGTAVGGPLVGALGAAGTLVASGVLTVALAVAARLLWAGGARSPVIGGQTSGSGLPDG